MVVKVRICRVRRVLGVLHLSTATASSTAAASTASAALAAAIATAIFTKPATFANSFPAFAVSSPPATLAPASPSDDLRGHGSLQPVPLEGCLQ